MTRSWLCKVTAKIGHDRQIACVIPGGCELLAKTAAIYIRQSSELTVLVYYFTLFRMSKANETQDFTCGLPSTGRHFTMRGEEGHGLWAPLAVLLHGISEVLPHYNLRVHHEGSMNFCKDKKGCIGGILLMIITGCMSVKNLIMETVCRWMAISKCFISIAFESVVTLEPKSNHVHNWA